MTDEAFDPYAVRKPAKPKRQAAAASADHPAAAPAEADAHNIGGIAAAELRALVERIERLEEEKKAVADDIKDVYAEAKGRGYHAKVIRQIVRLRRQDPHERQEEEAILDLYTHALGMAPEQASLSPEDDLAAAGHALDHVEKTIARRTAARKAPR